MFCFINEILCFQIGFYSEFSKQKLKALIADYTVKEVNY